MNDNVDRSQLKIQNSQFTIHNSSFTIQGAGGIIASAHQLSFSNFQIELTQILGLFKAKETKKAQRIMNKEQGILNHE